MDEAAQRIRVADHMLTMTFPLIKDPKLLIAVINNLCTSMEISMTDALTREHIPFNESNKLAAYKRYLSRKLKTPPETLRAYEEMRSTLNEHAQSPVAFRRDDKFVICNEGYKLRTLTESTAKRYVALAKTFQQVNA